MGANSVWTSRKKKSLFFSPPCMKSRANALVLRENLITGCKQAKSMVNSRAKCLTISQVLRAKLYNSCLIFVSYKVFYCYVVPCLTFSFLLFLIYIFIWTHKCLCFRAKLGARTRANLSSLSSLLSSTSAKMLTSLALSPLLYLLLGSRAMRAYTKNTDLK